MAFVEFADGEVNIYTDSRFDEVDATYAFSKNDDGSIDLGAGYTYPLVKVVCIFSLPTKKMQSTTTITSCLRILRRQKDSLRISIIP